MPSSPSLQAWRKTVSPSPSMCSLDRMHSHRCFIGKPRKPCCGFEMKAALVVLTGRHSQQQIVCLPVVPIGKQAQIHNVVVGHLSVDPCEYSARSVRSADCGGPGGCSSDVRSRRIASAHKELRNGSSKSEREPTSGRSTNYGSGHLTDFSVTLGASFHCSSFSATRRPLVTR
jgi:hypothetical protein